MDKLKKDKLFNLKSFIKDGNKSVRLESLRLPRDLSLGGSKPKKVYTPNLNVVRKKDQLKEIKKLELKKKETAVRERKANPNLSKQRYIQSSGVFSEGAGEVKRTFYRAERGISFRDNDSVASMILPTINHNTLSVNKKSEDLVLDNLANFEDEQEDTKSNFEPFELPNNVTKNKNDLLKRELKKEIDYVEPEQSFPPPKKVKIEESHLSEPFLNDKIYNDDYPALTVFRLPDSLAGKGFSDDPDVKKIFDYNLKAMLDGQIGKLLIRKSGKMEIQIGKMKYGIDKFNMFSGNSDLVNFSKNESDDSKAGMSVVGGVKHFFTLVPEWPKLI